MKDTSGIQTSLTQVSQVKDLGVWFTDSPLVSDISSLPYPHRLKCLGLYSLYYQRQRGNLIEAFKIINNLSVL